MVSQNAGREPERRYAGTITLTFPFAADDDGQAQLKMEFMAGLVMGFLSRDAFMDLWPGYAERLGLESYTHSFNPVLSEREEKGG